MRILFDENVPHKLRYSLRNHVVRTALEMKWVGVRNGELLRLAETSGFDVIVSADQNVAYQQNLSGRKTSLDVLGSNRWPLVRLKALEVVRAVERASPGSFEFVEIQAPFKALRARLKEKG